MKKFLLTIGILILFSGCSYPKPLTNEEIISEHKKCEEAGMNSYEYKASVPVGTYKVICTNE